MVRHLFLLRHGKSAWPEGVSDHDRPLAPRGRQAVPLMAGKLRTLTTTFDLAVVSDARRTQETFAKLAKVIPEFELKIEPGIYEAQPGKLFALVQDLPIFARTVLMIGHNPGFHALALYLANNRTSDADALRRLERKLPTAGLVHLEFSVPWDEIEAGSARLAHYFTPAMLGGVDED
jgi:phosphohistidine phosphatase